MGNWGSPPEWIGALVVVATVVFSAGQLKGMFKGVQDDVKDLASSVKEQWKISNDLTVRQATTHQRVNGHEVRLNSVERRIDLTEKSGRAN